MRPEATWRDTLWVGGGAVAALFGSWNALAALSVAFGGQPIAALFVVGWAGFALLVGAGAWRRTVWGCRFSHIEGGNGQRLCPRHATSTPGA